MRRGITPPVRRSPTKSTTARATRKAASTAVVAIAAVPIGAARVHRAPAPPAAQVWHLRRRKRSDLRNRPGAGLMFHQ
eukprot:1333077-Prymnesium_polylepis.1